MTASPPDPTTSETTPGRPMTEREYIDYEYTDEFGDQLKIKTDVGREGVVFLGARGGVAVPADKVEELCAVLLAAAGLPPVWMVKKIPYDESQPVKPILGQNGWIHRLIGLSGPAHTRVYAAQLLAAADEVEARFNRPRLPAAVDTLIKCDGEIFMRLANGMWTKQPAIQYGSLWFEGKDFEILDDSDPDDLDDSDDLDENAG